MFERVLIVGHGSIGKRHLRIVRESLPYAEIKILRHRPCMQVPELADSCSSSLDDACKFQPQLAVVANPAPFHVKTAIALLRSGSHVLVEKPLAETAQEAYKLLSEAKVYNRLVQVGYNMRFLRSLQIFRSSIQTGLIGKVLSIRCDVGHYLPLWRPESDYRHGVSANKHLGGGVLLELSHEFDYLQWVFGKAIWVSAWIGRHSSLEVDVEDSAHLTVGFLPVLDSGGAVAVINIDFIRHDQTRTCTVIGEHGSLRWDGIANSVQIFRAGSSSWEIILSDEQAMADTYKIQWESFMDAVSNRKTPEVKGVDGYSVLQIIESAKESMAQGGTRVLISKNIGD